MADQPIIVHSSVVDLNALDGVSTIQFNVGTSGGGSLATRMFNQDLLSPSIARSDASGVVTFLISVTTEAQALVLGAHRNDAVGFKSDAGSFTLGFFDGVAFTTIASGAMTAENTSTVYKLPAHTVVPVGASNIRNYEMTYTGQPALTDMVIPELFLGAMLEMPNVDYGYDPYNEVYRGAKFTAMSGRLYKTLHYRRLELNPRWSVLERSAYDTAIDNFREDVLETMESFWWAWMPDTAPNECYFMMQDADTTAFPIKSAVHRSMALKLVEDV